VTASDPESLRRAAAAAAGLPADVGGPVFREPWEAQAFAMTLALHERGVFTWSEWTEVLAAEIRRAQASGDPDTGQTYYRHWLTALEHIVTAKGVTGLEVLARCRIAWAEAARSTAHGAPIRLHWRPPQRE
jgi:nitrile hydratase accessory protein